MGSANGQPGRPGPLLPRAQEGTEHTLRWVFLVLLAVATGAIIVVGGWMIWHLDANLRSQGGGFHVGRGLLLAIVVTGIGGVCIALTMMLRTPRSAQARASAQASAPGSSTQDTPGTSSAVRPNVGLLQALDRTERVVVRVLQVLLGVAAGGVLAGGVRMISQMDAGTRSAAGHVYVGLGMLVALACIAGMFIAAELRLRK